MEFGIDKLFDENGNWLLDERYKEILRLNTMLDEANIPHIMHRLMDGWQIIYPNDGERIMDAIEHCGSYGKESDLLEIMGLLTPEEEEHDRVLGYLTAEEVFQRINSHYLGNACKPAKKQRKYRKGEPITSISELCAQEFVFLHHKIYHRGWFMSWQLRSAKDMVERGVVFKAERDA